MIAYSPWDYGTDWLECWATPLQVSGCEKSFRKKLDKGMMIEHDLDVIATVSIFWSLVQALMPSEVVSHVEECLKHEGLPCLAACGVDEGHISIICSPSLC